ncbi:putative branched-chain amino acid permease (azaleucine resistance) [Halanaeroarchaeum sp. HSR-CO]|uniref:AzlC family ABC transporter permease n=1 Tax=Halanaeroarchaeum sp. HSR-CO TaxID=2866382 RepID=UPI00217E2DF8|nr:AzlC family ABC transporter permease [Halanaeroarchaeum sp. HSR-CO]UWG48158.1 putative branched-chain amino acid permease (azaleucine resistance) [Halanaeroarchaeum sp. HSR-CO]
MPPSTSSDTSAPSPGTSPESNPDTSDGTVSFGRSGLRAGFVIGLPVALGVGGYGIAFGILAKQTGFSVAEAALMSATVLAGASQIVAVELWTDPLPVGTILVTTFAVNLRYSLMGAALQPWFKHLSARRAFGSLFFMADENWALTLRDLQAGNRRGAFLLGSGLALWLAWVLATIVGALAGGTIEDPAAYGIDFVLAAVFVALLVELWDGTASIVPWTTALVVALGTAQVLPGRWYILLGGIAAGVVEVIRYDRE